MENHNAEEPAGPLQGKHTDAFITLLGPKVLEELKPLLRLSRPKTDSASTSEDVSLDQAA